MGATVKIRQTVRLLNNTNSETKDENAMLMLESDEDKTEIKSLSKGRTTTLRKVTTKKIGKLVNC